MSSDLASVRAKSQQSAEFKQHRYEIKKLQKKNGEEYKKIAETGSEAINRMRKEQEMRVENEKVTLENKLNDIRARYSERIKEENKKFEKELEDIKKNHADQMAEIEETQQKQIEKTVTRQKDYLDAARLRFEQQKSKYEA